MELRSLTINNFKNIESTRLEFSPKTNCFLGNNGMGKSNLLDAIHYLSFCKSFSGVADSMAVRRGEDFLMVSGDYMRAGIDEHLQLGIARGRRKTLRRGGKEYQRLSTHIGLFPLVMVGPGDIDLIRGAAEERRRWIDMVISQSDNLYLDRLIRYGHALEQRNRMLRDHIVDHTLFDVVETTMEAAAAYITAARRSMTERLAPIFRSIYSSIAGDEAEQTEIVYDGWDSRASSSSPSPEITLRSLLDSCRRHDEAVGHTSVGPHRDDIALKLDSMDARRVGSQGQCKTFTIAMRLAQFRFISEAVSLKPLLLLDDIFDKLDAARVERIMRLVTGHDFGQIFVTDTNRTHLDEIMAHTGGDYRLWSVESGVFTPLDASAATQPQTLVNEE